MGEDGVKRRRRKASLSDSEIMTILLYFHFGSFRNFKHYYLFFIRGTLKSYFPNAVSYNRFVELESRVFFPLMFFLNLRAFGRCTGITFVDSTMIPICHNLRRYANKVFKGIATDGKGTMGWCHGFKLHLACNDRGEIIAFVLTGANVSDKDPAVFDVLAKRLYGKLFADKGYISQKLFDSLFEEGIQLVTGLRVNMKNKLMPFYDKMMLRKRYIDNSGILVPLVAVAWYHVPLAHGRRPNSMKNTEGSGTAKGARSPRRGNIVSGTKTAI